MNDQRNDSEAFRTLQLMKELEENETISQRELASRLGVAVGLVNSYLKNLTAKGWIRIKNYPRNRYAYLLTPKGFAEKSKLAYQHLSYFNNLFTAVRQDYVKLFKELKDQGHQQVVFCGVDEVAEIAYLSLREAGLDLVAVVDDVNEEKDFFGLSVLPISECPANDQPVVITSVKRGKELKETLELSGTGSGLVYLLGN